MSVGDLTASPRSASPTTRHKADEAVDLALQLVGAPDETIVEKLLEVAEYRYPVISQGRGVCLARLRGRPSNTRDLLRALDMFALALDRLETGR